MGVMFQSNPALSAARPWRRGGQGSAAFGMVPVGAEPGFTPPAANPSVDVSASRKTGNILEPLIRLMFSGAPAKRTPLLLPIGTPVLMLHGTSNDGNRLYALNRWFKKEVIGDYPNYVCYLPEVQRATGIKAVKKALLRFWLPKPLPASDALIRELGAFRFQMLNKRLAALDAVLRETPDRKAAISRFFQLRGDQADLLAPLIERHILAAVDQVPKGWHSAYVAPLSGLSPGNASGMTGRGLRGLVAQGDFKLRRELRKLHLRPAERNRPVYDSQFLFTQAGRAGRQADFRMRDPRKTPEKVNIRAISLEDTSLLEGYLVSMEQELAAALEKIYREQGANDIQASLRADCRAGKLMDTLAPQALLIAHSQGSTAQITALLDSLAEDVPKRGLKNMDPREFKYLGGRSIGFETLLSGVLSGLPEDLPFGVPLMHKLNELQKGIPGLRDIQEIFGTAVKKAIWWKRSLEPAVVEMRAGSALMERIKDEVDGIVDSKRTVISAYEVNDWYVPPEASQLRNRQGLHPKNVFHLPMKTEQMPPYYGRPNDLIRSFRRYLPLSDLLTVLLPEHTKGEIHNFYKTDLISIEQHRALITYISVVMENLGKFLLKDPQAHPDSLDVRNFEPYRYETLKIRTRLFEKECFGVPLAQGAENLQGSLLSRPDYLQLLFDNIREDLPTTNSASWQAYVMVRKLVELLGRIAADPALQAQYKPMLTNLLTLVRDAELPTFESNQPTLSRQAEQNLKKIS